MSLMGLQRHGEMRNVWRRNGGAKVCLSGVPFPKTTRTLSKI